MQVLIVSITGLCTAIDNSMGKNNIDEQCSPALTTDHYYRGVI